ncbi:hypothetical protein RchiOBHm_Chr2g0101371 [Rosa chinensis]|uniref:Uncharacterized protein n=1 Tax=Rosa chinensis TaxID=74649 RepID=A0A2P6RME5_ROSCH|nr:hypothetical protein RchiOBHm_Chr2g0101371 [Rosa chinensis]
MMKNTQIHKQNKLHSLPDLAVDTISLVSLMHQTNQNPIPICFSFLSFECSSLFLCNNNHREWQR